MRLVDSHCHLNYLDAPTDAISAARERGVEDLLCIGVEADAIDAVLDFAGNDEHIWATVGEHPGNASEDQSWIMPLTRHQKVIGLGEMGLDYHYEQDAQRRTLQRRSFAAQMNIASETGLPVVIHTRSAEQDTLQILGEHPEVRGVLHCFTESWDMAEKALDMGYFISISGIVTFANADNVRHVARQVPDERLLIETDAPWLAPVPHRGKQNQPAFVADTAAYLAELRDVTLEHLAEQTYTNFWRLFGKQQAV